MRLHNNSLRKELLRIMDRNVNRSIVILFSLIFLTPSVGWSKTAFQINENYGSWSSDSTDKKEGSQNVVYFSLGYQADTFGVTYLGSHTSTTITYDSDTQTDFDITTMLDSTLSTYFKIKNRGNINTRIGLDINLPTGHASLTNDEINSILIDNVANDLNTVSSYGRGLDIAPNAVFSRSFDKWVLGLAFRYQLTGEYDPTEDVANDDFDPGDTMTFMLSSQYNMSKSTIFLIDITSAFTSRDRQDSKDVFKQGNRYDLSYRWIQRFGMIRTTYGLIYGIQGKNQSNAVGPMTTEDRNSNNNRIETFLNLMKKITQKVSVNSIIGYKDYSANELADTDPYYDAGYNKMYLGAGTAYSGSKSYYVTANLRLFSINNKKDIQETEDTSYTGYNLDLGFVYSF